jgi:choline dehydrogenase-like flavoprotein
MAVSDRFSSLDEFLHTNFDYLIVGGGTAGLVVASRLAENPKVTVGVVEAGSDHFGDDNVEGIGGVGAMLHNPEYDWSYQTTPQVIQSYCNHLPLLIRVLEGQLRSHSSRPARQRAWRIECHQLYGLCSSFRRGD